VVLFRSVPGPARWGHGQRSGSAARTQRSGFGGRLGGYNGEVGSAGGPGSRRGLPCRDAARWLDLTGRETKRAGGSAWRMSGCAGPPFHCIALHGHPLLGVQPFVVRAASHCRRPRARRGCVARLPFWRSSFGKEARPLRRPLCREGAVRSIKGKPAAAAGNPQVREASERPQEVVEAGVVA